MHKFLYMYLFLFLTLYVFRAHRAHHQDRQIVSIQLPLYVGGSVLCRLAVGSELRSNLSLLGSGRIACMKRTNCRVYSR